MQLPKQKGVLMFKRAAILIGSLCFAFLLFSAQAPKVQDIKVGLEYVVPEDVGWSSQKLEEAKAFAEKINSAAVSDLLKSRSGVYHEAAAESEDMVETRPTRGSHPHDTFFYYNNWDFNALGTIFEKVTGAKIFEAFKREIAEPIG
ncbi:MAG: serine hydrolase, partial [Candidatus Aminicenantes bacterium]|nr:serine hydrolase [Candidatus Aminicenantes bacterium]